MSLNFAEFSFADLREFAAQCQDIWDAAYMVSDSAVMNSEAERFEQINAAIQFKVSGIAPKSKPDQDSVFLIVTRSGMAQDIDTIISGPDAAKYAFQHKESLREMDWQACDLLVIMCKGDKSKAHECAEFIADMIQNDKRVGRKTMLKLGAQFGVICKPASFKIEVTAQ